MYCHLCISEGNIKGKFRPTTGHNGSGGGGNFFNLDARLNGYPLDRRMGGPFGWYGRLWKISPPPGFELQTIHPIADGCAGYTIRVHSSNMSFVFIEREVIFWGHLILKNEKGKGKLSLVVFLVSRAFLARYVPVLYYIIAKGNRYLTAVVWVLTVLVLGHIGR